MEAIGWAVLSAILCLVLAVLLYLKQVVLQSVLEFGQYCMIFRVVEVGMAEQEVHADHRQ